jgi:hypothetical protein
MTSQVLDVHHVGQTEQGIDVDARLKIFRQSQGSLNEFDLLLSQFIGLVIAHAVDLCDHLRHQSKCVRDKEHFLLNILVDH